MKWILFFILLCLTACDLKPPYTPPEVVMPEGYRFESDDTIRNCDPWASVRWWEQFQDPCLNQLIAFALHNNQDLAVAAARVLEFYAKFKIVASQLYPEINFEASYLRQELTEGVSYSRVPPALRVNNLYTWQFTLSYELDFWGSLRNQAEAAFANYVGTIEDRRTVVLTLLSELATAYIQLRQFDKQLEIAKLTYESRVESWRLANLRYDVGLVSEMEVSQTASQMYEALVQVRTFEEIIPQQEDLISVLIGGPSQPICRCKDLDSLLKPFCVPVGLPSSLLLARPDIVRAELDLMAANALIGVARAAFFPQISLTGLYGGQSTQLGDLFSNISKMWNIGFNIFQPIFTGGRLVGQLREAEAVTMEALHTYLQKILVAFQEVNDALIAFEKSQERVEAQKKQVAALADYYRLAYLRYENGQNDYLTVLDAERSLFAAQLDLANNEGDVLVALISIYKSLGGGWVTDADCLATH